MAKTVLKFIDLFAGIGGIRLGLEQAAKKAGFSPKRVFTSEIKEHAINILKQNHPKDKITGDITQVDASTIPDFDILCGGFPCQAFSAAGNRDGFADTIKWLWDSKDEALISSYAKFRDRGEREWVYNTMGLINDLLLEVMDKVVEMIEPHTPSPLLPEITDLATGKIVPNPYYKKVDDK